MKKVLKSLPVFALVIAMFLSLTVCSFAADLSKDGTYSVNVTLYHSEKDKESMGNKYIVQTGLITVENGKKYITIVANDVDDLTFSYYLDGSTEGEKATAQEVENVEINGTVYPIGFKFPLVTDSSYVGVAFKAPVMPVSPSARLKIDYSSAKLISGEETTAAEEETEEVSSIAAEAEEETSAEETTALLTAETETEAEVTEASTAAPAEEAEESGSSSTVIIIVIAVIVVAAVLAVIFAKKAKKKK